jgi:hypothetical protein
VNKVSGECLAKGAHLKNKKKRLINEVENIRNTGDFMKTLLIGILMIGSISSYGADLINLKCDGRNTANQKCSANVDLENSLGTVRFVGGVQCYNNEGKQIYVGAIKGSDFSGYLADYNGDEWRFMLAGDNLNNLNILKVHVNIPGEHSSLYVGQLDIEMEVNCKIDRKN